MKPLLQSKLKLLENAKTLINNTVTPSTSLIISDFLLFSTFILNSTEIVLVLFDFPVIPKQQEHIDFQIVSLFLINSIRLGPTSSTEYDLNPLIFTETMPLSIKPV